MKQAFIAICIFVTMGGVITNGCKRGTDNPSDVTPSITPSDTTPPTLVHWKTKAFMPTARQDAASAVVDGKIYVFGGLDSVNHPVDMTEIYNPATDTWSAGLHMPIGFNHAGAAAVKGKIYVIGGSRASTLVPENLTWEYDPASTMWTRKASMPYPRAAAAVVNLADSIYVFGGVGTNPQVVLKYVPALDVWMVKSRPLPTPREHLAASVVAGTIYVIGGRDEGQNLGAVETYSPDIEYWLRLDDYPIPRSSMVSAVISTNIYVMGGELLGIGVFPDDHMLDTIGNEWIKKRPMLTARHGMASGVVNGKIYVIGGGTMPGVYPTGANEEYTP